MTPAVSPLGFADVPRLELDQLLEQLQDRAGEVLATQGRLRGLLRANAAVAEDLSLSVVLHRIVHAARELVSAAHAAIAVNGPHGDVQQFVHTDMLPDLVAQVSALPKTVDGPLVDWAAAPIPDGADRVLCVSIRVADQAVGTLYLIEKPGRAFTVDDTQLATALAATAGGAIANARLFTESELRRRWLGTTSELTNQLLSVDIAHPLAHIVDAAMAASDADFATLVIPYLGDQLIVEAVGGALAAELIGRLAPLEGSLAGLALTSGKATLRADYHTETAAIAVLADAGPVIIVPLTAGERTRGALSIGRLSGRVGFTEADLSMASSFATQAAVTLELVDARDRQQQTARMDDRDRIAFDLHDHVIQELFALGMGLQGLASVTNSPAHVARIGGYINTLDRVVDTIRASIFQLQAHRQDPAGLRRRILAITEDHTEQLGYSPQVRFAGTIDLGIGEAVAEDILAITREALSNCARHADATRVGVYITLADGVVTVQITDNGCGIASSARYSGLRNMRDRAERHAGTLHTEIPHGGGTSLIWTASVAP